MNIDEFDEKNETFTQNSLLLIQNSRVIKAKKRSRNSNNRSKKITKKIKITTTNRDYSTKRQRVFENFTRREFSIFEYINLVNFTNEIQIFANQFFFFLFDDIRRIRNSHFNNLRSLSFIARFLFFLNFRFQFNL